MRDVEAEIAAVGCTAAGFIITRAESNSEEREGRKMTADHFEEVLDALTSRRPFKPFTIELHGGERIESDHPGAILWSSGNAIFRAPGGTLVFFDQDSVNKITDAPAIRN